MKNSRLEEIFQTLDKKERFEVNKALRSPFFNQRGDVQQLWELLCESKETPNKEEVFAKLYPTGTYEPQRVRAVMSWLMSIIEKTLIFLEVEKEEIQGKIALSSWYRKRGLGKHFNETLADVKVLQEKKGLKNASFYRESYLLEVEAYAFDNVNRTQKQNLQVLTDDLDMAFILEKLRQAVIMFSHQAVYSTDYDTGLFDMILQYIEKKPHFLENIAISTYYYCYQSQIKPADENNFQIFKKNIMEHYLIFSQEEIRDLYLLAINYVIKKINKDKSQVYTQQVLELYKKSLTEGYLLENNILSRFTYRNIVGAALILHDYAFAEKFIYDYKNRLERTYRDSMFSFSLARLEYSRKNYDAALLLLQKAEYRDTLLALAAKTILLKIYYEKDEFDLLDAHLASMRAYLKRKRVMGYHQTNYKNIIHYTQKIINLSNDKKKNAELREAISKEEILTEKEWLLERIESVKISY